MSETNLHKPKICSDYLSRLLYPATYKLTLKKAIAVLKKYDFDAIAFRGMSGAIIAPAIAAAMGKTVIMVRKAGDGSHSTCAIEGDRATQSYVIVDDFISSGATVQEIESKVAGFTTTATEGPAKCLGVLELAYLPNKTRHCRYRKLTPVLWESILGSRTYNSVRDSRYFNALENDWRTMLSKT